MDHCYRMHGPKQEFKCTQCPRTFNRNGNRLVHEKSHNHTQQDSEDRKFVCTVCSSGFFRNSSLKRHMRRHTGERPYECTPCQTAFGRMFLLTQHKMSKMHARTLEKLGLPLEDTSNPRDFTSGGNNGSARQKFEAEVVAEAKILTKKGNTAALINKNGI